MRFHVVTTTNARGWDETGRRMARSFIERWPADALPLTVYAEDFEPDVDGVEVRQLPGWLAEFKALHGGNPAANGMRDGRYSYTHDAVKFAHKVAALTDFGEGLSSGILIWLDADIFTHADVTPSWLRGLLPDSAYMAWLDRHNCHPECGFLMFRCDHAYHRPLMASFHALYTSGDVFKCRETHDSYVLQQLVAAKVWNRQIPAPSSLSGRAIRTTHPAINGPLGACIDHLKGPRKQEGKSPRRDLILPRTEAYWRA